MLSTIVVTLCSLTAANLCVEKVVTDQATLMDCAVHAQLGVADWMEKSVTYRSGWRVEKISCVIGRYEPKRNV